MTWNEANKSCELSKKEPSQCNNPQAGNPILLANGDKRQTEADYTDLSLAGSLNFVRTYNGLDSFQMWHPIAQQIGTSTRPLGENWTHNWALYVATEGNAVAYLHRENGREYQFVFSGGSWQSDADVTYRLQELISSGVRAGWEVTTPEDTVELYNDQGYLSSVTDRQGLGWTLTYSDASTPTQVAPAENLLIHVTNSFGRRLAFTYDSAGHLASMTDPSGHVYTYSYDNSGNLKTVIYPDETPSNPSDNPKKTYVYGGDPGELANTANLSQAHALTGLIDENGVRYATYQYDASGKAISTEHFGGVEKYSLAFAPDGSYTDVTDPLGSVRKTHFTTILGVAKSTGTDQTGGSGCAAASNAISYDANGNIASKTDFNGHKSCYAYEMTRNLEIARVEGLASGADCATALDAAGLSAGSRKISTEWHSSYRLPVKIAEPKRLTTFSYDASGHLLSRSEQATRDETGGAGLLPTVQGSPRVWSHTYNALGQVLTEDGPRTDVSDISTYSYYDATDPDLGKRGNLKTLTHALNQVTQFNSYDGNGRLTQVTAPNGVVTTYSYTPRGQLSSMSIGPNAETTTYSYTPTNLLASITRPDGSRLTYRYDNAHRLIGITDSLGNRINEQYTDPSQVLRRHINRVFDALNRLQHVTGASQ